MVLQHAYFWVASCLMLEEGPQVVDWQETFSMTPSYQKFISLPFTFFSSSRKHTQDLWRGESQRKGAAVPSCACELSLQCEPVRWDIRRKQRWVRDLTCLQWPAEQLAVPGLEKLSSSTHCHTDLMSMTSEEADNFGGFRKLDSSGCIEKTFF